MTIAQEEAIRKHADQYKASSDNGIRKSKRLQSFICNPNINTSKLRKLHKLFWNDNTGDHFTNDNNVDGNFLKISSRISLKKVHSNPNVYTIDNFLTQSELQYFHNKIKVANQNRMFKTSFIDNQDDHYDNNDKRRKRQRKEINNCENKSNRKHKELAEEAESVDTRADIDKTTCSLEQQQSENKQSKKQRTSSFIHFSKQSDSIITSIEQRACEMLSLPHDNIEPLQLVKYQPGQYFQTHHDLGVLYDDGSVELPQRINVLLSPPRRIVTILVYLNTLNESTGGSTKFPLLKQQMQRISEKDNIQNKCISENDVVGGECLEDNDTMKKCLEIQPKKGMAVVWCNITKEGVPDTRVVHSGEALFRSASFRSGAGAGGAVKNNVDDKDIVKYVLNIWACEY